MRAASKYDAVLAGVDTLEAYMRSRDAAPATPTGGATATVRFLSSDLVSPDKARIKVYMLERAVSLAASKHLWTLGGLRGGLALLRELWDALGIDDAVRGYPEQFVALSEAAKFQEHDIWGGKGFRRTALTTIDESETSLINCCLLF